MIVNWIAVYSYEVNESQKNREGNVSQTILNTIIMSGIFYVVFLAQYILMWVDVIIYHVSFEEKDFKKEETEIDYGITYVFWEMFIVMQFGILYVMY